MLVKFLRPHITQADNLHQSAFFTAQGNVRGIVVKIMSSINHLLPYYRETMLNNEFTGRKNCRDIKI